ncbi:hypothetical protein JZO77_05395 [Enterococcus hulanensis]|uniref:hypothetical protein n=1 Tax=Enterococcus hulanensis TaxID=2559929 RepID=UPI001A8FA078|nr:hypothetical protein [Enterococcus hulanensis]MBO0456174.1 hypothetical protein [Enterococcus hulanensis]
MNVIKIIFNILNFFMNVAAMFWIGSFLLYGGEWKVGNFMSITLPGLFRNSKRAFRKKKD